MRRFFMVTGILIPVAVIAVVIQGAFIWRRRSAGAGRDRGIGTPRRFYFYSISFIALMLLVSGVTMVLMSLLGRAVRGAGRPGRHDQAGYQASP